MPRPIDETLLHQASTRLIIDKIEDFEAYVALLEKELTRRALEGERIRRIWRSEYARQLATAMGWTR